MNMPKYAAASGVRRRKRIFDVGIFRAPGGDTRVKSRKLTVMSKKGSPVFSGKEIGVTPESWQTVMSKKKVVTFSGKNRGDTLSCRPG